jgi:hypothetical protein
MTTKKYHWSSHIDARDEYDEWRASLLEQASTNGIGHCIRTQFHEHPKPQLPSPPVSNTDAELASYRLETKSYEKNLQRYYDDYAKAVGLLTSSLDYACKARVEIDAIINEPPPVIVPLPGQQALPPLSWEIDDAFKTALLHLETHYAPQDATDGAAIRLKMQALSDETEGGFAKYAEAFVNNHNALIRAKQPPSTEDLLEWVIAGLKNTTVLQVVTSSALFQHKNKPTFEQVFVFVQDWLKRMGDANDPYKSARGAANQKAHVAFQASLKGKQRPCTRCWGTGHWWDHCNAKTCNECNATLIDKVSLCPNRDKHQDPKTRWEPPSFNKRKAEEQIESTPKRKKGEESEATKVAKAQMKESYKALKASRKADKADSKDG